MIKSVQKEYLEILKARRKKPPFTKDQVLAEEIWLFFKKDVPFPALLKIIKQKGYRAVYEIFNEVRKSKFPNKPALFLSLVKKEKVVWLVPLDPKKSDLQIKVKKNVSRRFKKNSALHREDLMGFDKKKTKKNHGKNLDNRK